MIELTKSEVGLISGGFYYAMLGTALGAIFVAGWVIVAVRNDIHKNDWPLVINMAGGLGAFGATIGCVVGITLDGI